ncbi:MAG: transglutaminase-like domain-containing protein [Prevotellaceae bacterium]|nr:transglutaminase-like domain-containing protein [Prevotellaceae bacterium]
MYALVIIASEHFTLLGDSEYFGLTMYFASGMLVSCVFHAFRFRFFPSFLLLLILFAGAGMLLDNFASGEFDSFFLVIKFQLFRALFLFGWICGYGFSRTKYFPALLSTVLIVAGIYMTAVSGELSASEIALKFVPVPVFAFYIIFMNELLRNTDEDASTSWIRPVKGLLAYLAAILLLLFVSIMVFDKELDTVEAKWNEQAEADSGEKNSLYDMMPDSSVKIKSKMQINDKLNRGGKDSDNSPLFVAYIDNFFPQSDMPNPLYLVSECLPLFDDYTETFERDSLMPASDMFALDPSTVPLYFTATDTAALRMSEAWGMRRVVETEIYKIRVSASEFIAPATAFYCQPIAVRNELKSKYSSAYRAKSMASELNSAYFVYNNSKQDYSMQAFQEQRFELLRRVKNFADIDTAFLNYYTRYPKNAAYDTVRTMTQAIVDRANAKNPMDKILAVRDYFMTTDEFGVPVFHYSDVATTVPPGSRILNFLLNDHKGNCTYYAGSTFLMLRACGIPCRIATGYATVDRSSNNKGWYWIYSKQAHAWVQVFFPGYGWLDFDTTFGDQEQEEAPNTDGTPPLDPGKAWFAATGVVKSVDTVKQSVKFDMSKLVYFDREYHPEKSRRLTLDLSLSKIFRDSVEIKLSSVAPGDKGLAISFTQTDDMKKTAKTDIESVLKSLPAPVPVDEFRVEPPPKEKSEPAPNEDPNEESRKSNIMLVALCIVGALALLMTMFVFSIPYLIFVYYSQRAKRIADPYNEAYYAYRAAMFLLYQTGFFRHDKTPLQYAGQVVDKQLGTSFELFTATYLKVKYARQKLTNEDSQRILSFYKPFERAVKSKTGLKKWILSFINIYNTLEYFTKPRQ